MEVLGLLTAPLLDLVDQAREVHRRHHADGQVQLCEPAFDQDRRLPRGLRLLPAVGALRQDNGLEARAHLDAGDVLAKARIAKAAGATRFCMGAAWREVKDGAAVRQRAGDGARRARAGHGGVLHARHADRGAGASASTRPGSTAYNHNLDTSREFYGADHHHAHLRRSPATRWRGVRKAGITVCSGGIIGMGESLDDRCGMLRDAGEPRPAAGERADQRAGPPSRARRWRDQPPVDPLELVRMIATARILMPRRAVRLSAGRTRAVARGAGALLPRRRQLDLLRREAAHHRQPRRGRRPRADRAGGAQRRARLPSLMG